MWHVLESPAYCSPLGSLPALLVAGGCGGDTSVTGCADSPCSSWPQRPGNQAQWHKAIKAQRCLSPYQPRSPFWCGAGTG